MSDFTIEEIGNGFIITGPRENELPVAGEAKLYVPSINAVGYVLAIWQETGFEDATIKAKEICEAKHV